MEYKFHNIHLVLLQQKMNILNLLFKSKKKEKDEKEKKKKKKNFMKKIMKINTKIYQ